MCAAAFLAACDTDKNGDELPGEGLHGLLQGTRLGPYTGLLRVRLERVHGRAQLAVRVGAVPLHYEHVREARLPRGRSRLQGTRVPCVLRCLGEPFDRSRVAERLVGSDAVHGAQRAGQGRLQPHPHVCREPAGGKGGMRALRWHRGARMVVFTPRRAATGGSPWRAFGRAVTCRCSSRQSR